MISYSEGEFESQTAAPQMPALGTALTLGTKESLPKPRVRSPKPQVPSSLHAQTGLAHTLWNHLCIKPTCTDPSVILQEKMNCRVQLTQTCP